LSHELRRFPSRAESHAVRRRVGVGLDGGNEARQYADAIGACTASTFIGIYGAAALIAAMAPTDRIDRAADLQTLSTSGTLHVTAALTGFVCAIIGMIALTWAFPGMAGVAVAHPVVGCAGGQRAVARVRAIGRAARRPAATTARRRHFGMARPRRHQSSLDCSDLSRRPPAR
jgi:hypothetical protein